MLKTTRKSTFFSFPSTKNNVFFKYFLLGKKREKNMLFSGRKQVITLPELLKVFFLRRKSKRKGKGAVSSAPLSFVSSLTKRVKNNYKSKSRK